MRKKCILFIGESATFSHIVRPWVLLNYLDVEKYDLVFASSCHPQKFTNNINPQIAIETLNTSLSNENFNELLKKGKIIHTPELISSNIKEDYYLFDKYQPDLVIGDFRLSLGISAASRNIPYVNIAGAAWHPDLDGGVQMPEADALKRIPLPIANFIFKKAYAFWEKRTLNNFNKFRTQYNLKPYTTLRELYTSADYTLYPELKSLFPVDELNPKSLFIGPVIFSPETNESMGLESIPKKNPWVLISMGSSGDHHKINNVINYLSELDVEIIISTANKPYNGPRSKNIWIFPFLNIEQTLQSCQLFISHGGSGSIYSSLYSGTPLLAFPNNLDQWYNMHFADQRGIGKTLRLSRASKQEIQNAINDLIKNPIYKQNTKLFNRRIKNSKISNVFNDFIDGVMG